MDFALSWFDKLLHVESCHTVYRTLFYIIIPVLSFDCDVLFKRNT